jgi:hypothetical protein
MRSVARGITLALTLSLLLGAGVLLTRTPSAFATSPSWTVVSQSQRGVVVDRSSIVIGTSTFSVARFHLHRTAFHWHAGFLDPPNARTAFAGDTTSHVSWSSEGAIGVVGVFNGGFKVTAKAGGVMADNVTLVALTKGLGTVAIDNRGVLTIGKWGRELPRRHFAAVSYRQNLPLLIDRGVVAPSASRGDLAAWGSWFGPSPYVPRTALGIDASGNVLYVATMNLVSPNQIARALLGAGAVEAVQLDINPFWPILGLAHRPLHRIGQSFSFSLPNAKHRPEVLSTSWLRDFFVVMSEPNSLSCSIVTNGPGRPGVKAAHYVRLSGTHCPTTTVGG